MDDLLASIRKIIADGHGDPEEAVRAAEPASHDPSDASAPSGAADSLPDILERSIMEAFSAVDDADDEGEADDAPDYVGEADLLDEDAEAEENDAAATLTSIATAIAAECQVRKERSAEPVADRGGEAEPVRWRPSVLSEPGIVDRQVRARAVEPAELAVAGPPLPPEFSSSSAQAAPARGAASAIAGLKARLDPRFVPGRSAPRERASLREADVQHEPDMRHDAATPPPMPQETRSKTDQRTADMTDSATVDAHAEAAGNMFRRQPAPARSEVAEDGLTSQRTRQQVNGSFEQLSRTILSNNPRTLEDLVRDMMRPLLREWLEANLPDIVERQVRQEIDRVASRGR